MKLNSREFKCELEREAVREAVSWSGGGGDEKYSCQRLAPEVLIDQVTASGCHIGPPLLTKK